MTNILILEDDSFYAQSLVLLCKRLKCNYATYEKPSDAIRQDMIKHADLIICDYDMLDESALNLLQYLKENKINKKILINSGNIGCRKIIESNNYQDLITAYTNKFISLSILKKYI